MPGGLKEFRASYWTRWPDEHLGPLYVGIHLNQRQGQTAVVGLEIFTEPPSSARQSGGPEDGGEDLMPVPPVALRLEDVRGVSIPSIVHRLVNGGAPEIAEALEAGRARARNAYPDGHWERVAATYRSSVRNGVPVQKGIAVIFGVSSSTAARWITKCRALGLLPATRRGRKSSELA